MTRSSALLMCLTMLLVCAPAGLARADDRAVLPGGELQVSPSTLNAAVTGQAVRFTATLDRREPDAALLVTLPARWVRTPASGIRTTRPPRLRQDGRGRARLEGDAQTVALAFSGAAAGTQASFEIVDRGIPAGRYVLPLSWRRADGTTAGAGSVAVTFRAPRREDARAEARANPLAPFRDQNVSNDSAEESEAYIAADPADPQRVLAGINTGGSNPNTSMSAWITNDGGTNWTKQTLPQTVKTRTGQASEVICCDPMAAADSSGDLWFGGIAASHAVVARVSPGQTTYSLPTGATKPAVLGLDAIPGHSSVDKPMMTIDDGPASPHRGRLYVVWNAAEDSAPIGSAGISIYVAHCDTWSNGAPAAARCDDAGNWSIPAEVTKQGGSYIYASVAAGADGTAYVTWWDYSSENAIVGASCPAAADCAAAASWTSPQIVALLDTTDGVPVPFACPIVAQPGGRASPAPQVSADRASGRIYVVWGDLRPGSGSTRCDGASAPMPTDLRFDAFVASKSGGLPGSAAASAANGTQLLTDAQGAADSDDWFPAVAVDQSTGIAYADFYSTVGDATRKTTSFNVRSVGADGTLGALKTVSTQRSDYSTAACCTFGNDYGDYTGIDAAQGVVWPVWTQKTAGTDGELFTSRESGVERPPAGGGTTGTVVGGAGPLTPLPVPPAPADTTPPQVRFGRLASLRIGADRLVRIPLAAPTEDVGAALDLRTDGRVRIEGGRHATLRLGRTTFVARAGVRRTVRVRVKRRDVDRVRRLGRVRAALTLTYVDAAGNRAARTARFTLLAPRRR